MSRAGRSRWPASATAVVAGLVVGIVAVVVVSAPDDRRPGPRDPSVALPSRPSSTVAPVTTPTSSAGRPTTTSATTMSATTVPGTTSPPGSASAAVDRLVVAEPPAALAPYRRDAFGGGWDHDPATGCNTRERVLIEESLVPPTVDDRCRSTNGRWRSVYDGVVVTDVADLQIDHFIPLADAWRSGAAAWTDDRRRAFANDLTSPQTLVAVTGSTNASKSDSTPDEWLPPDRTSWCGYATAWVDVKATWALTVTPREKATLVQLLAGC